MYLNEFTPEAMDAYSCKSRSYFALRTMFSFSEDSIVVTFLKNLISPTAYLLNQRVHMRFLVASGQQSKEFAICIR